MMLVSPPHPSMLLTPLNNSLGAFHLVCAFHGPGKQGVFCEILCAFISSCVRVLNVLLHNN